MVVLLAALIAAACNPNPIYTLKPVVTQTSVHRDGSSYRASAHIAFKAVEEKAAVVHSKDPGLIAHVRGHGIIANRVALSSNGVVQASGNTSQQARSRLHDGITRMQSDLAKELAREERVYDTVTENGAAQSQGPTYGFPGGPDSHDPCAH